MLHSQKPVDFDCLTCVCAACIAGTTTARSSGHSWMGVRCSVGAIGCISPGMCWWAGRRGGSHESSTITAVDPFHKDRFVASIHIHVESVVETTVLNVLTFGL